jgi:hypothetical protein
MHPFPTEKLFSKFVNGTKKNFDKKRSLKEA